MSNKVRKQVKRAQRAGYSTLDVARMREVARREAEKMESRAIEKSFLYMLAIPLNVLVNDYWPKSAKKKAPEFIEKVASLYKSVQSGVVTDKELADLLEEYAGMHIDADWMNT